MPRVTVTLQTLTVTPILTPELPRIHKNKGNLIRTTGNKKPAISNGFLYQISLSWTMYGGSTWESNPPGRFLIPPTGFEDRAAHQRPKCFHCKCRQPEFYISIPAIIQEANIHTKKRRRISADLDNRAVSRQTG